MKLQQFDGGVATRLAPQLLSINQGVVYENIDNAAGVLAPMKDKQATAIQVEKYQAYFNKEKEWLSSSSPTDYLEFQGKMYLTPRSGQPKKYSNGVYNNLGIVKPSSKPVARNNENRADPVTEFTVLNRVNGGDLPAADFDYLMFNVKNGFYSSPFLFTVYASTDSHTKANGRVVAYDSLLSSSRNTITTDEVPTNRSVEFNKVFGVADNAVLFRYFNGAWHKLYTFNGNVNWDVYGWTDAVFDISSKDILDETLIAPLQGTYQYVYTYYNATDNTESAPSEPSIERSISSGWVTITSLNSSNDPQVTTKRLYRVGGNSAKFTLVVELDKTVTSYVDKLKESRLDGRLLESDNYYEAPSGLGYLTESYAMLFGALGSSLRFTPVGNPNAWPPEYEIQFEADITGIGPVANGLLVFTRYKTYIITGTGPLSLAQQTLRGDQGCIAHESITEASEGTLIWASEDGLCTSSGNNVRSLTKHALNHLVLEPVSSVAHNEVYYCHNADGTILAWDYRFNQMPKWLNLDTEMITSALGQLYGYKEGLLYLLYKDTANLTFKYKSPRFVEGSFSEAKTYKKVYIRSKGDIIIDIIIDNVVVSHIDLTGTDTHMLQVPQSQQRGYSIQFAIEGTGTVEELEYVASMRKNA